VSGRLFRGAVLIVAVILAGFVWQRLFGDETVTGKLVSSQPVAAIGSGTDAVAIAEDGTVLTWLSAEGADELPKLPLETPPKGDRVKGPVLEQVKVLAAIPPALLPYVEGSYYGESGVDVDLTSGIELRFGNAAAVSRKWKAAAAVLADPSVTALDYVDLHAPAHPAVGGSGHTLPPLP
jgi:cell division septal protein FtsQ